MGRFVAILFVVLLLISAVILFFIGQIIAGVTAVIGCGYLIILLDFLEKMDRQGAFQKALSKTLAPVECAKEIKRNSRIFSNAEFDWAIETLNETKGLASDDQANSEPPTE